MTQQQQRLCHSNYSRVDDMEGNYDDELEDFSDLVALKSLPSSLAGSLQEVLDAKDTSSKRISRITKLSDCLAALSLSFMSTQREAKLLATVTTPLGCNCRYWALGSAFSYQPFFTAVHIEYQQICLFCPAVFCWSRTADKSIFTGSRNPNVF